MESGRVFFNVGMADSVHFSVGHPLLHNIIFFPLDYKLKKNYNLHVVFFAALKF